MMPKAFLFLLIIWNPSTFASRNGIYYLEFLLGCQAVIPCEHKRSESNSFKWFYMKDIHSNKIQIFFQDKTGLRYYDSHRPRGSVTHNRSLVIQNFTEDDQGLYWCESCYEDKCKRKLATVIRVKKEIHKTFYVTAGGSFTYECPGEFTNLKWTFDASNATTLRNSAEGSKTDFVTSNKSIHIVNVKRADAGIYTCWTRRCNRHRQKLLTVDLCVIAVNSTHAPTAASNNTTDAPTESEYLTALIYGTSAALACLVLLALLIFYSRWRLWAVFRARPSGIDDRLQDQTTVVYTSVVIRGPAKTTNICMTSTDCVYSEIKV